MPRRTVDNSRTFERLPSSGLYLTRVKHLIVYNTNELVALNLKLATITNIIYNKIKLHYITVSKTVELYRAIR